MGYATVGCLVGSQEGSIWIWNAEHLGRDIGPVTWNFDRDLGSSGSGFINTFDFNPQRFSQRWLNHN